MATRIVDGVKLVEVEPGAPLPPGVPSCAERCDVVEAPDLSPAQRSWVIGAGAVGALGSAIMIAFFSYLGVFTLFASLVALFHGLVPGTKPILIPSQTGRYLGFEHDAGKGHGLSAWDYAILVGMALFGRAVDSFVPAARSEWIWIATAVVAGVYLLYHAAAGRDVPDPPETAATLRFRALADPARSLAELLETDRNIPQEALAEWTDSPAPDEASATNHSGSPPDR
jgi:hypothetical protein